MIFKEITKPFLIFLSGFILSLSSPSYDLSFLAWIGLIPLFVAILTSDSIKKSVLYSFLFGLSYNLSCLKWLLSLYPLDWLGFNDFQSYVICFLVYTIVSFYSAIYFSLFAVCAYLIKEFAPSPYNVSVFKNTLLSLTWVVIFNKLSASKILLGFPWALIEYSQYKNLNLIQIGEFFGGEFIAFLIVFFNIVLAEFFIWIFSLEKIGDRYIARDPGQLNQALISFVLIVMALLSFFIYGQIALAEINKHKKKSSKKVCVLQGNLPIKYTRGGNINKSSAIKTYENLAKDCNAKIIIGPEGSLPTSFSTDASTQSWFKELCKKKNASVIFGSYCKDDKGFTNCAVSCSPNEKIFSYYKKERLVPFGEFTPFSFILPKVLKEFASFTIGNGFEEGRENILINTSIGKIGINICFELIFPSIIRKQTLLGAKALVNLSDLSWFSDPQIRKQFLSFGVFRAIENRKPIIISSNDGISAFIEHSGRIQAISKSKSQYILTGKVVPNNNKSFYVKYGW